MHGKMSKQNAWSTVQCCTQYHIRKCQLWSTASCAEHSNQTETCINRDPDDPTLCAYKCPAHPMNIHQVWSIASYCLQCTHQWSLTMETHQVWMEVEVNCLPACGNKEIYMPALRKGHVKCTAYYCMPSAPARPMANVHSTLLCAEWHFERDQVQFALCGVPI